MHPKNSITPLAAQAPMTNATEFRDINSTRRYILQVLAGVCAIDALEDSSCLLSESLTFMQEHLDEETGLKRSAVWLLQDQLATAKAILDAAVSGLIHASRTGGAQ